MCPVQVGVTGSRESDGAPTEGVTLRRRKRAFLPSDLRPQVVAFTESGAVVFTHWSVARLRAGFSFLQGASERVNRSVIFESFRSFFVSGRNGALGFRPPPESCQTWFKGRSDCGSLSPRGGLASFPVYFLPGAGGLRGESDCYCPL